MPGVIKQKALQLVLGSCGVCKFFHIFPVEKPFNFSPLKLSSQHMFMTCSVKYHLSIGKLKMLITSACNNASTKTLYRKICLRRLIHHTKLYAHCCNEYAWREDRSLTSDIQLSMWVLYYRDPMTFCTSIIESFKENRLLLIFSVTEKSKQIFSVTYKHQGAILSKNHTCWINVEGIMNF